MHLVTEMSVTVSRGHVGGVGCANAELVTMTRIMSLMLALGESVDGR